MQPFITVGIASYNYSGFLPKAFEAIKRQKFTDFEVLYADDGSTDNSVSIIEGFIANNPNMDIRLVKGENVGVLGNKNRIIEHARGKYIMFCDADDYMDDGCLETLAGAAKENDADRVVSQIRNVDGDGRLLHIQDFPVSPSKWTNALFHGALFRRSIMIDNDIRLRELPDDYMFVTVFNFFARKTAFVEKAVYNWSIRATSTGRAISVNSPFVGIPSLENVVKLGKSTFDRLNDDIDRCGILGEAVKRYYSYFLSMAPQLKLKELFSFYDRLHSIISGGFPEYRSFSRCCTKKTTPLRPFTHKVVALMIFVESIHMMKPFIAVFKLVTKVYRFDF